MIIPLRAEHSGAPIEGRLHCGRWRRREIRKDGEGGESGLGENSPASAQKQRKRCCDRVSNQVRKDF